MDDLISRQEILRAFEEMCSCTDYGWDERDFRDLIKKMPSAQPELIEKASYIRGFEQGRTQGMIDSQGEKMEEDE